MQLFKSAMTLSDSYVWFRIEKSRVLFRLGHARPIAIDSNRRSLSNGIDCRLNDATCAAWR